MWTPVACAWHVWHVYIWTWGENTCGRLGHLGCEDVLWPRVVEALQGVEVVQLAVGGAHMVALTGDGCVWTWGEAYYGQCAVSGDAAEEADGETRRPAAIQAQELASLAVVEVAAGGSHTMVSTEDGQVWACGSNANGQLGLDVLDNRCSFTSIPALHRSGTNGALPTALM